MKNIRSNKQLLNVFSTYSNWSKNPKRTKWMLVLTLNGTPHYFYTRSKTEIVPLLNEITEAMSKRCFTRMFMSTGKTHSINLFRIAKGSQMPTLLEQVA